MSLRINTNPGGLYSSYQIGRSQNDLAGSINKLSTGRNINKASDDASGMVIADRLASQALGYGQAIRNANDAASIGQIADGAFDEATSILQGVREKAIQAASGAHSAQSLGAIQSEIDRSLESLRNIAQNTSYNGQNLLSGAFTDKSFQIGAASGETISMSFGSLDPSQMTFEDQGALADIDVTTGDGAQSAISVVDAALSYVSGQRAQIGSNQNQLESTINNLRNAQINTLSAESEIRDLDFAEETMNLNRIKLLAKARSFAQSQNNTSAGRVLDLLG